MADDAAVAQSSIGQRDVALTPMANAIVAATIANGGQRMNPYLVNKVTKPDLSVLDADRAVVGRPGDPADGRRPAARDDDRVREGR